MRIGFDAKRLYNNFTGLGNYSRTLLQNLHEYYPVDEYHLYTPGVQHSSETDFFLHHPDYTTHVPASSLKSLWRSYGIKKDLKKDGIELYHGLSHEIPFFIYKTGIRTVVSIHDIIYKTYPDMFPAIDRAIYDLKFRYSCKHANKIIAISESTKSDIIRYFNTPEDKIEVIYQSINPVFYQRQTNESISAILNKFHIPSDYLLYVGAINSRKNLLGIIKAYAKLPQEFQLPIVIIGNGGQYKKEVLNFAAEHQLSHRLILLSNVGDSKVLQAFYQNARIFIYPSFYEGFGLPVTEALLCKTPVITSSISSLPEAGGKAAWYISPDRPDEITETIKNILTMPQSQLEERGEQGMLYAKQKFAPELLTTQTHNLYHSLI